MSISIVGNVNITNDPMLNFQSGDTVLKIASAKVNCAVVKLLTSDGIKTPTLTRTFSENLEGEKIPLRSSANSYRFTKNFSREKSSFLSISVNSSQLPGDSDCEKTPVLGESANSSQLPGDSDSEKTPVLGESANSSQLPGDSDSEKTPILKNRKNSFFYFDGSDSEKTPVLGESANSSQLPEDSDCEKTPILKNRKNSFFYFDGSDSEKTPNLVGKIDSLPFLPSLQEVGKKELSSRHETSRKSVVKSLSCPSKGKGGFLKGTLEVDKDFMILLNETQNNLKNADKNYISAPTNGLESVEKQPFVKGLFQEQFNTALFNRFLDNEEYPSRNNTLSQSI